MTLQCDNPVYHVGPELQRQTWLLCEQCQTCTESGKTIRACERSNAAWTWVLCQTQGVESHARWRMWVCVYISVCTGEDWWETPEKRKRENQTSTDGQEKVMDLITRECPRHRTSHPPCGVTLFCCTVCRSWRRCWTRAAESAAGTGPVGTASGGWSRGSGWLWLNRCAEYSQWDRKLRKMWKNTISMFGLSNVDSTCLST